MWYSRLSPAIAFAFFLTSCGTYFEYTLANHSDQNVVTWAVSSDCEALAGGGGAALPEKAVRAGETATYGGISAGRAPRCVLVADRERRIVLSEPFLHQHVYTVGGPAAADAAVVPGYEPVSPPSPTERLQEAMRGVPGGPGLALTVLIGSALAVCLAYVLAGVARRRWRPLRDSTYPRAIGREREANAPEEVAPSDSGSV